MKDVIVVNPSLHLGDPQCFHILGGVCPRILLREPIRLKRGRLWRLFAIVIVVALRTTCFAALLLPDLLLTSQNDRLVLVLAHLSVPL